MKEEEFKKIDLTWMSCPVCGFDACKQYTKGKNKGLYKCYECDIRWTKPKIYNQLR